jgi:exosome complex component RRP4
MKKKINEAYEATESEESAESTEEAYSEEPVKKRKVVIPGEIIVSGEDYLPGEGARREGNDVIAARFGLAEEAGRMVKVIAITGAYIPRRNNIVLGRVIDITFHGWLVDIDSASSGFLPLEESPRFVNKNEMDQFLAIGDVIAAKIWSVKAKGIDLSLRSKGLGKLEGGFMFRVIPNRVPRIIGREGSMINLIKEKTGCNITVGQNGWIWIKGESLDAEIRTRKAIEFIAEKVCVEGLTEKMEEWFEKNK